MIDYDLTDYDVIDRDTGKVVLRQTLVDAHGQYNPEEERWQERYMLWDRVKCEEVEIKKSRPEVAELLALIDEMKTSAQLVQDQAEKVVALYEQ